MKIGSMAKSIVGGVAAGAASLVTAVDDGVIVYSEWVTIALAVLGALGVVYVVPNAAKSDPPAQTVRGPYPMS
ncbi:hypothetical protein ABZU75_23385 [Streptosporangium sp. NPDC005286]|uniref:hypothetical protein n=1 Tax=Streptosporangium sp. NPDC005286 TaxID=3154463 RepID=UPI0033A4970B